mmetsp:Transcript_120853/g.341711  ORF Transcript_120853/g.341711 Transcript_120853/m.341711 type:complete len:441 (-) Transcript_120853:264-1586(-)
MLWRHFGAVLLLASAGEVSPALGAVLEGELPATSDFAEFVGKFCYDYKPTLQLQAGTVALDVWRESPTKDAGRIDFLMFDDEEKHWKNARKKWAWSSCQEKIDDASIATTINLDSTNEHLTSAFDIHEHLRPRFWYFSFVACGLKETGRIRYRLHVTNPAQDWQQEFSMDHLGLVKVYAFFAVAFMISTFATLWATPLSSGRREHPYIVLLILSYLASDASCLCYLVHYGLFMAHGHGSMRIRFLGIVAGIAANCTIFLIAMLSSVGWAISRRVLPRRRCFLGCISAVGGLSAICELHAEVALVQSTRLYAYQSSPGVLALILKVFMFCWFAYQTSTTYEEEALDKNRRFYRYLGVSFTAWAINVPLTVLLAFMVAPHYRHKVVATVDVVARFLGQALLAQILCGPLSPITAQNSLVGRGDFALTGDFDGLDNGYEAGEM